MKKAYFLILALSSASLCTPPALHSTGLLKTFLVAMVMMSPLKSHETSMGAFNDSIELDSFDGKAIPSSTTLHTTLQSEVPVEEPESSSYTEPIIYLLGGLGFLGAAIYCCNASDQCKQVNKLFWSEEYSGDAMWEKVPMSEENVSEEEQDQTQQENDTQECAEEEEQMIPFTPDDKTSGSDY